MSLKLHGGTKMNRKDALNTLAQVKPELAGRFGVTTLALFGSMARDDASRESDIDILVAFDGSATSAKYFGVQFLLEDLFGCRVDLVTEKALRSEIRAFVKQEAIYV
jgi:hypothetical protein